MKINDIKNIIDKYIEDYMEYKYNQFMCYNEHNIISNINMFINNIFKIFTTNSKK